MSLTHTQCGPGFAGKVVAVSGSALNCAAALWPHPAAISASAAISGRRRVRCDISRLLKLHPCRLELSVLVEGVQRLVASKPRLLVTAERDGNVVSIVGIGVDGDAPAPQRAGERVRLAEILGPDGAGQPIRARIRDRDGLLGRPERDRR